MFKNIERKQIAIDERQRFFQELEAKDNDRIDLKNKNLSQLFEEEKSERNMFDTKFIDSVAHVQKCSQINDSLPFKYVS